MVRADYRVFNFQMNGIKGVCTAEAAFDMTCPGINTFFTAAWVCKLVELTSSVFWGTFGPPKLFGPGGQYVALLSGFPVGFALPIGAPVDDSADDSDVVSP